MTSSVAVPRIRRTYNRWVANETLEDYALRFTAFKARRFSPWHIANTAIGAVSFLALEAIGASITLNYGFTNAVTAILVTSLIIFLMGIPVTFYAAKFGVDIDLLSRGAGFGYIGSTVTSLIYASFTFIFFAIEAAIVASALELITGLPLSIGYLVSALVVIPLVTHGISFISRFQAWTQPFWVVLQIAPFAFLAVSGHQQFQEWTGYTGILGPIDGSFALATFGAASAILFSLVAQIGEQVDYLRFLPRRTAQNRWQWWSALLSAGPGWIVIGMLKILAGSFLAYYAFKGGVAFDQASDPTHMYLAVFRDMIASPEFALGLTGIFVVICQLKINVTNSYAGSIAWSNFFSRLTHSHPGRVVWVVFNVLLGLLLMEFQVYKALEEILGLYAIVAVSWMASIVADLVINKPLGLSPKTIEFKRAHLYDINPVGLGSMIIAALAALLTYLGLFGEALAPLYSYVALGLPLVLVPLIAVATRSRYYLARTDGFPHHQETQIECCICEHSFDSEDMARCPVYAGPICSLCCSLDALCHDRCKVDARFADGVMAFADHFLPARAALWVRSRLARYLGVLALVTGVMGIVFWLIYFETSIASPTNRDLELTLTKLFVIMFIIAGIVVWLFILAQESRKFAEEEMSRHTQLLLDEIKAHEETDRQLKLAKEAAESANLAKSKYVVGLSHELRTPLSAILGYAQLLERLPDGQEATRNAARTIKRSGEHLAGMIEGLLDISKIEAGKLEIYRDKTALRPFLDQIVDMFSLQAKNKGIAFEFNAVTPLPDNIYTDEKRLRQVLINLLSNAIKFTREGKVSLSVSYRNQIATMRIADTGIGIAPDDLARVFLPFERAEQNSPTPEGGTGLGLTITKLLVEIMGGDLTVESKPCHGSCFTIRLMLSSTGAGRSPVKSSRLITGYHGRRKTIVVVDDQPNQRALLRDILSPLGFNVLQAADGTTLFNLMKATRPDLIILDVAMPGMSGWEIASHLRAGSARDIPILMVSADAGDQRVRPDYRVLHDGYLVKPFILEELFDQVAALIPVVWSVRKKKNDGAPSGQRFTALELPDPDKLRQLYTLGEIGFARSIEAMLNDLAIDAPMSARFCEHLRALIKAAQFSDFLKTLETAMTTKGKAVSDHDA